MNNSDKKKTKDRINEKTKNWKRSKQPPRIGFRSGIENDYNENKPKRQHRRYVTNSNQKQHRLSIDETKKYQERKNHNQNLKPRISSHTRYNDDNTVEEDDRYITATFAFTDATTSS